LRKIITIIADDEPLARERVHSVLEDEPDVDIVAECADGAQALKETQKRQPDLLFLDVQMPRLNGFEVLEALWPGPIPVVIFTTAHDEHAIRAFEFSALDYLLKPFTEARFKMSLQRARAHLQKSSRQTDPQLKALLSQLQAPVAGGGRIFVRSSERILFLKPEEIDRVEAAGNYVVLHSGKEQHIIRETISAMEARLASAGFMRISRSVIVRLACIREIQPAGTGRHSLLLKNGTRLDMTCSLGELQARLGEI
jgi:two-component system LytT family response regulator